MADPARDLRYAPKRIQRKRTKGWRMPEGAVYVGRPTIWGNPWRAEEFTWAKGRAAEICVEKFRRERVIALDISELRGKDLACWCPLDKPCHADVLLELANA